MKRHIRVGLVMSLAVLGLGIAPRSIRASVPHTLTQQGRLFDASDKPITGKVDVTFAIYDKESAGGADAMWSETQSISFEDGWFSVALGDEQPIGGAIFTGEARWLGIKVGDDNEMMPRASIRSVPFALVADNATGDITPKSVSIPGVGKVIDENGQWVGDPAGLAGPQGPEGPMGPMGPAGSADSPVQVLTKFNDAVQNGGTAKLGALQFSESRYDLRWAMLHAAAAGACAAASPQNDSQWGHIVIPRGQGSTCAYACANNTPNHKQCRTSLAIGGIQMTQAMTHSDVVGTNYNYSCDATNGGDEILGEGLPGSANWYAVYCCCYH